MLLTVQRELAKRLPSANFFLRTSQKQIEEAHSCGLFGSVSTGGPVARAVRLAGAYVTNKGVRRASRLSKIAAEEIADLGYLDCVVDISGFNYSDEWGLGGVKKNLAWALYCNAHDKQYICLPQAWGPFRIPRVADAVKQLCKHSSVLYARDKVSLSFLRELLGPDDDRIKVAPDIAFLFPGASPRVGRDLLEALGVDIKKSLLVGIAPNMRVYERCRGVGTENEYIRLMTKVAEHCIRTWGASVILLSHMFSVHKVEHKDDRFLCGLIKLGVSDSDRCFAIRKYISASVAKSIAGQMDLMIGSRFHSLLFALSSGVPAVALGWAHKYPELMELVGLDGNALIHTDFDEKPVIELLDKAWANRAESKTAIRERLPEIRKEAVKVFDDVAETLGPNK